MTAHFHVKPLGISDAEIVQDCYDSQPKLMLTPKTAGDKPYADTFRELIQSGCVSFGAFKEESLSAFCVVYPWQIQPTATLVLFCNRPTGGPFNPGLTGLRDAIDATLLFLEQNGYSSLYFVRAKSDKWRNSLMRRTMGRLGQYHSIPVETITKGNLSRFDMINGAVLGMRRVISDAVVINAVKPYEHDF